MAVKSKDYEKIFSAIKKNDSLLINYAKVYLDRFSNSFNRNGKRFIVEIHYSQHIIGMFFKIIDEKDFQEEIVFKDAKNNLQLKLITSLSSERITEQLFVQKDVRGFEKEYFYIFKPNEKRLWHKAIAQLDVYQLELELGMMDLVEEDAGYISLAGLIIEKNQGDIKLGTKLDYQGIHFEIVALDGNRIKTVLIRI